VGFLPKILALALNKFNETTLANQPKQIFPFPFIHSITYIFPATPKYRA